ncbi:MAG: ABC transporter permease [Erysipelotrichaceae bacterium]|nr:ABC transporter permease [Erysipelotrichaceae bacterium]
MSQAVIMMIVKGIGETVAMVVLSTLFGYLLGLPLGVLLYSSDKDGIHPNPTLYRILDFCVNISRSIPFIILLVVIIPFTKMLVGKSYGTAATIVPLTISAIPFIGRMVESSLKEVDKGVIEAAQSMGASDLQIITGVLLRESLPSLVNGITICLGTIVGYSALAGAVGGGGLGDIAIRYGYYRYQSDIMIVTLIIIVILVQLFQFVGTMIAKKIDKR